MVVHGHVVANYVNAQRAVTFTDSLLFIPGVTHGNFRDHIVGKKAPETCDDLGVITVYIIRRDELFHLRHLEDLHHVQGQGTAFPMVMPDSVFTASYHLHPVVLESL